MNEVRVVRMGSQRLALVAQEQNVLMNDGDLFFNCVGVDEAASVVDDWRSGRWCRWFLLESPAMGLGRSIGSISCVSPRGVDMLSRTSRLFWRTKHQLGVWERAVGTYNEAANCYRRYCGGRGEACDCVRARVSRG